MPIRVWTSPPAVAPRGRAEWSCTSASDSTRTRSERRVRPTRRCGYSLCREAGLRQSAYSASGGQRGLVRGGQAEQAARTVAVGRTPAGLARSGGRAERGPDQEDLLPHPLADHWVPGIGQLNLSEPRAAQVAEVLAKVPASDPNSQRVRVTLRSALGDAVHDDRALPVLAVLHHRESNGMTGCRGRARSCGQGTTISGAQRGCPGLRSLPRGARR
jgi:hypothetical protein